MTEAVYFFDNRQQLIKVCGEDTLIAVVQEKEITTNKSELMNDTLTVSVVYDEDIKDSCFMAVREDETSFSMYKIVIDNEQENALNFTGIGFAVDELDAYIVKEIRPQNEQMQSVINRLLAYTDGEWRLGHIDSGMKFVSGSFYYISVREALKQLQELGCEVLFKCSLSATGVKDKWVEVYKKIGKVSNTRFDYGDNALKVVKERIRTNVYTSLIGRGKGEEVGDGYGRRIDFEEIEWKKSEGKPLDKPKGQTWLEYPEMTKLYGTPTKSGLMKKRERVSIYEDIEDPEQLINATYEELVEVSRPLVQFSTEILGSEDIGNTITIHRDDRNFHYQTRVFKVTVDRLGGRVEAGVGDNLSMSSSKRAANTFNSLKDLNEGKMSFYDSTEISKWQSDIIRGAKGGSVIMMSPSDFPEGTPQHGESREPFQVVWMNGDSIENSNHFLVANSEGIGFIDGDFNMDNFKTAWTIDGVFNADYIKAGKVSGVAIESLNKSYKMLMDNGRLSFFSNSENKMIGYVEGASVYDTGGEKAGMYITQKSPYMLNFMIDNINGSSDRVIYIVPKDWAGSETKMPTVNIDALVQILGDLSINGDLFGPLSIKGPVNIEGSLTLNGQTITGGTGGGGADGWANPLRSNYIVTQEWDQEGWGTPGQIHGGIDLASVPSGSMPNIYAAKKGKVITASYNETSGNYVMIDHGDNYYTYYGHFNSVSVSQGQSVTTDTVLGKMGTTGLSTGVHLHFEVRKGGSSASYRINPRDVINF